MAKQVQRNGSAPKGGLAKRLTFQASVEGGQGLLGTFQVKL
jgi:hypothetical protein